MPLSVNFSEQGLKTLIAPPPPARPLSDIILAVKVSRDLNTLATIGRHVLRGCISSRRYGPPIGDQFEIDVDEIISDRILARVALQSSLLERLKVHEVANDPIDIAHILCAYLGATFMCSFKESGSNQIHDSINDICAMVLDDSAREETEADSHEAREFFQQDAEAAEAAEDSWNGTNIQSSQAGASAKLQPFNQIAIHISQLLDNRSAESVSSGMSPPPLLNGAHYQQPFQPYYHSQNATIAPPHMLPMHAYTMHPRFPYAPGPGPVHTASPATFAQPQPHYNTPPPPATMSSQAGYPTQPPGAMPQGGYPGMGMPQNPGFAPPPAAVPVTVPAPQGSQGYISLVNEIAMKNRKNITWQQAKVGQQHMPEWTMWLSIDGEVRGQGTAPTKQAAKELASRIALQTMGWMPS